MHVAWVVSVGEIVTWVIAVSGFCYTFGRLTQRVDAINETVDEHKADFRVHEQTDTTRFEALNQRIAMVQSSLQERRP